MRKTSSLSTSKQTTFIKVKITLRNIVLLGKCGLYCSICFMGGRRKRCRPCRILSSRSHQSVLGTIKKPEVVLVESAHRRLVFIIYRLTMCKCYLLQWCLSTISPRNHQIYPWTYKAEAQLCWLSAEFILYVHLRIFLLYVFLALVLFPNCGS